MATRVRQLQFRSVEEFYNLRTDPGCFVNLLGSDQDARALDISDKKKLNDSLAKLREWMIRVEDLALHAFVHSPQPEVLERFVQDYRARAAKEVEALKPYEKQHGYRF